MSSPAPRWLVVVLLLAGSPAAAAPGAPSILQRVLSLGGLPALTATAGPVFDERPTAGSIVVNAASWAGIVNPNDGITTLYEAILYADQDVSANTISFDSSLNGKTIGPSGWALPAMTGNGDQLVGDFGTLSSHVLVAAGLSIQNANGCLVRGLCLPSLTISGSSNCKVESCHFGLALDGKTRFPATGLIMGVEISSASSAHPAKGNVIGGQFIAQRNYFGANSQGTGGGPYLTGEWTSENWVYNNYVGLEHDGVTPLAVTPWGGVTCANGAHDNHIGDWPNRWNSILVTDEGVSLDGAKTTGNLVRSNYIGISRPVVHGKYGITIRNGAHNNQIGGPVGAERLPNVIENCDEAGVLIGDGCNNNVVTSTYVGLSQWGGAIIGGGGKVGVSIGADTSGNRVGGALGTWRNWFAEQTVEAISVGARSTNTLITGNWIGFDADNSPVSPGDGIGLHGAAQVTIGGGLTSGAGDLTNVIGGCSGNAIHVETSTGLVTIQSNIIGLSPDRKKAVANDGAGIFVEGGGNVLVGLPPATKSSVAEAAAGGPPSTVYGNTIANCERGVYLKNAKQVDVFGNLLGWDGTLAWGNQQEGVRVSNSQNIGIGDQNGRLNRIVRNGRGVVVSEGAHNCNVACNQILQSKHEGVVLKGPVHDVSVGFTRIQNSGSHGVLVDGTSGEATRLSVWANMSLAPVELVDNGGYGVAVVGSQAHAVDIMGAYIGVLSTPTTTKPHLWQSHPNAKGGILIDQGAYENAVGGFLEENGNRVCCNKGPGVLIQGGAHGNRVEGNFLGHDDPANGVDGNTGSGLAIQGGAHDNVVGRSGAVDWRNYIAGNHDCAIRILGSGTDKNLVVNTYIGMALTDWKPIRYWPDGNSGDGVEIAGGAQDNTIGESSLDTYSVVVAASRLGNGIRISDQGTNRNKIVRCRIGTDPSGNQAKATAGPTWGNDICGVLIENSAQNNVVGGPNNSYGNQISNNDYGVTIQRHASNNYVAGNLIGTRADGAGALGNHYQGLTIEQYCSHNYVGSGTARKENTISGNAREGIIIRGDDNEVTRNFVGTDLLGSKAVPNGRTGVYVKNGSRNQIKAGNVISANAGDGVVIAKAGIGKHLAEDNLVDGNTIGFSKSASAFIPNGTSLVYGTGTGVAVRPEPANISLEMPIRTQISNNQIYASKQGLRFYGDPYEDSEPPTGSRALANKIGFNSRGQRRSEQVGVFVQGAHVYVADGEIAGVGTGVLATGDHTEVYVRGCRFHDNSVHVQLADQAFGQFGEYGAAAYRNGGNVFGASQSWALDAFGSFSGLKTKAENDEWGSQTKAVVAARIRFRSGDSAHTSVDFDPIAGGVHPSEVTAAATAGLTSLNAQPTARGAAITLTLSGEGATTVQIINLAGRLVRTIIADRVLAAGVNLLPWDGVSTSGTRVPAGRYLVRVTVRAADGRQTQGLAPLTLNR